MEVVRTPARVDLCGPLRIEIDGERLEGRVRGRQGRLLFAYLVLHRHAPVSRERLTDALWSGDLPADPSGVLNTLLSGLRRTLGEGRLEGRRELRIDLGPDARVDVETAMSARDAALAALACSQFAEAAGAARITLDITRQELLAGESADWVDRRRDEMAAVRADALEALARASVEVGGTELATAVTAATELVELDPYRESAYALLMEAHAARGNVALALRVFDRVRTLLRDDLGAVPARPLLDLHQRLLTLDRATDGDGEPPLPLPAPLAGDAGFVGRHEALERLRSAFAAAGAGKRRFVMLTGEPGIGKTTLAAHFAREAHAAGAAVLYGRSSEEPLLSYEPFVEALCHYIGTSPPEALEPAANPELEELGRWMPDLGRPVSEQAGPLPAEPDARRYRMFEAMAQLLARIGRDRILVFVFDDLHWADGSALRLLRHVARATRPNRLLLLGTYRDADIAPAGDLARLLGDVRREAHLEELSLAGLDDAETAALVTSRGGAENLALAARLRELTAGNPYFLEEMLRAVVARGEGAPGGDPLAGLGPPRAVTELIERRLARLPGEATRVLAAAAVLGMAFRLPVLEEIEGDADGAVLELLEAAVAARLLVELPGAPQWFSFAHALVRTVLYEATSRSRRLRLHRKAGEVLEARRLELSVGPAELAEHFFAARELGEGERALRYAAEAGAHATASLAYEDAARHFE
ncbi:MAG: AAA family ATPase, partial [Actinomycetota bacterium]|nr:AAA family ATPase [Actinomycetota bacterium]